jgi:flagellar hook assembly protein FlgD
LDAWPNPFNPRTDLRFDLAAPARGSLDVFDLGGRHLRRLAEGGFAAGAHQFAWDGRDDGGRALPSGVYFARLAAPAARGAALGATRKLVLLR